MFLFNNKEEQKMAMNEVYEVIAPDGQKVIFDKKTNLIISDEKYKDRVYHKKERAKMILDASKILQSSPYNSYKPIYLDPAFKTGQSSTLLEFKAWRDLYLKNPPKGKIAPWTHKEKAYYESLQTKRERCKYLMIRSGLRSTVIDIPFDAYCGVDENGNLINNEYEELYYEVDSNKGDANLRNGLLTVDEWNLAAGLLGDIESFSTSASYVGFKTRCRQVYYLKAQLGSIRHIQYLGKGLFVRGLHKNPLRKAECENLAKSIKPDKFGMFPYIDEIVGVDWIMDFNRHNLALDSDGSLMWYLDDLIEQGTIKDPRDRDSTKESREEFKKAIHTGREKTKEYFTAGGFREGQEFDLYIDLTLLETKVAALTPPQDYPNAPTYYIPEYLDELYKAGKLDKKLNPTIPAIYREFFPQELRDKIEWYAKKHNIK